MINYIYLKVLSANGIPSEASCIDKDREFITPDLGKACSTRHNKIIAKNNYV